MSNKKYYITSFIESSKVDSNSKHVFTVRGINKSFTLKLDSTFFKDEMLSSRYIHAVEAEILREVSEKGTKRKKLILAEAVMLSLPFSIKNIDIKPENFVSYIHATQVIDNSFYSAVFPVIYMEQNNKLNFFCYSPIDLYCKPVSLEDNFNHSFFDRFLRSKFSSIQEIKYYV